jgi:hypothetical protein
VISIWAFTDLPKKQQNQAPHTDILLLGRLSNFLQPSSALCTKHHRICHTCVRITRDRLDWPLFKQVAVICIARLVQSARPSYSGSWYRFHILGFLDVQRKVQRCQGDIARGEICRVVVEALQEGALLMTRSEEYTLDMAARTPHAPAYEPEASVAV